MFLSSRRVSFEHLLAQVRCGDQLFEMHASVVTCGSQYFRGMLEHAMAESASGTVELQQVPPGVFRRVLHWLYTGELGGISDVREGLALLEGSRFLRVERMEAQCCTWLCARVDASNCVEVWAEASRMAYDEVEMCALRQVGRNFARVAAGPEFLALAREPLLELLRSDRLVVRSEQAVYEAVMGWVRHDEVSRCESVGAVLSAVRMALLPSAYLACTVSVDPLVTRSHDAVRIVLEAHRYNHLAGEERVAAESVGLARKRKQATLGIVVVGMRAAALYDPSTEQWSALPDMSVLRIDSTATSVDGSIYVLGGHDNKSAERFDPSMRKWRMLPDMSVPRSDAAAACVDGLVYVVGGLNGISLQSCECYDPSTRQWSPLPDMSVARDGCAAACVNGCLHVVGGRGQKSAECYDPSTRQWRALPDMSVARFQCAAVSIEGILYVIGGFISPIGLGKPSPSAECYDPAARQWRALPAMSVARVGFGAGCLEGCVYVVGGTEKSPVFGTRQLATAEMFDPVTGMWSPLPSMLAPMDGSCSAVTVEI